MSETTGLATGGPDQSKQLSDSKVPLWLTISESTEFYIAFHFVSCLLTETAAISSYEMDDNTTTSSAYQFERL